MRYAFVLVAAIFLIGGCGEQPVPAQVPKASRTPPRPRRPSDPVPTSPRSSHLAPGHQAAPRPVRQRREARHRGDRRLLAGEERDRRGPEAEAGSPDVPVRRDRQPPLRFADDKGGDLTRQPEGKKIDPFFEDNKPIRLKLDPKSDAGEVLLLGYGTPTPGATRLLIDADLVFLVGSGERTAEQKGVEPKPGTKVEVGPLRMTFKDPKAGGFPFGTTPGGGNDRDEMPLSLTYEGSDKLIKAVEWLDPDGKVATTTTGDWFGAKRGGTVSMGVPRMSRVGIRVVYYETSETITVPLRIDTGVGF